MTLFPLYMNNKNDNMHMLVKISPFILYSRRTYYNVILLNLQILYVRMSELFCLDWPHLILLVIECLG